MKSILEEKKFKYLGFATLDSIGRVFMYKGRIFRGIYPGMEAEVKKIFDSGVIDALTQKNLFVKTTITRYKSKSFPMILEHKRITTTLPTDWSASMLKDAAKAILCVNEICNKYGYELSDSHPYNISFEYSTPKWIDLGSIKVKKEGQWRARAEFIEATIAPLVFMTNNEFLVAYSLLQAGRTFKLLSKPFRETITYKSFLDIVHKYSKEFDEEKVDVAWIDEFCKLQVPITSFWGKYQLNSASIEENLINSEQNKFKRLFQLPSLVKEYAPDAKTSVDLAGNTGLLSFILSKSTKLSKVINIDYDPVAIDYSYLFLRSHPEIKVESYLQNFMLPMQMESIPSYKSDIVFALAITHHLLLSQGFKIDGVFENIKQFANKYVFIEFMPLGLWSKNMKLKPQVPEWYTLEWFTSHFSKHFKLLKTTVLESQEINQKNEPHRVLFIGEIMKQYPTVSVITVTHNIIESGRKEFFLKCLQSVHSQKYENVEHIIVDGASTDGTQELLKEYAEKGWITYISEPDSGMYEAMNRGIELAKGDYIAFLNSDDMYNTTNAIGMSVNALVDSQADFSYAPVQVINPDGTRPQVVHYHENPIISDVFVHMPFSHQSMFIKRSVLLKENMYDTEYKYAGDYDLTLRLCLKGYESVFVNEKFATYRIGGKTDQNEIASSEEVYRVMYKNFSPITDVTMRECREIYGEDITKVPFRLAQKLRNLKPYFNFTRYTRLLQEKLVAKTQVIEKVTKHPIIKFVRKLQALLQDSVAKLRSLGIFRRRTYDMMELWHNQHIDAALAYLPMPRHEVKALVIGCNRGEECEIMYNKGVRDISGIDLIDELGVKFQGKGVKYYSGYAENMYLFEDNTYDLVYSFATFEHVQDIENAYKEAARVTKPGGIIYIFASPLWNSPYGHHYDNIYMGYPWIHLRYTEQELVQFCEQNGINTNAERIDHMLNSNEFNRRSSYEYLEACNNVQNVQLISNQVAHVEPAMEHEIDPEIIKKGYKVEDLMSIWHLFIARKR